MATEDKLNDYDFTGTDAGASHTIPSEAGQIRKGGYIVIKGHPCKVGQSVGRSGDRSFFRPFGARRCFLASASFGSARIGESNALSFESVVLLWRLFHFFN